MDPSVQVVVLDYDPDGETLKMAETHSHPAEIWQLASCPAGDPRMLLSVYSEGAGSISLRWLCCNSSSQERMCEDQVRTGLYKVQACEARCRIPRAMVSGTVARVELTSCCLPDLSNIIYSPPQ